MIKKLKRAINIYFVFYPKSARLTEFKDELLSVLIDKYNELLSGGMSEKDALDNVTASIDQYKETANEILKQQKRELTSIQNKVLLMAEAVLLAFAVALYFILSVALKNWSFTWIIFIIWAAVAVGGLAFVLLIKVKKNSPYILIRICIMAITMLLATAVYFVMSFIIKDGWSVTWLVFIFGLGVAYIADIAYRQHHKVMRYSMFDWLIMSMLFNLTIYFGLSFGLSTGTGSPWSWTWVCFIVWAFVAILGLVLIKLARYSKKGMLKELFSLQSSIDTDTEEATTDDISNITAESVESTDVSSAQTITADSKTDEVVDTDKID